jgi:diguanylate cyclase (GGDEF)-like protein
MKKHKKTIEQQVIAVIGAANLDIVTNIKQEHKNNEHRGSIKFMPGGRGFRTALKLEKLGLKSYFLSATGNDFQSFIFEKELSTRNIAHKIIIDEGAGSNLFLDITKENSDNKESVMDEKLFNYDIDKDEIDRALENASDLVITFSMSQNNIRYAIEQANKKNITVFAVTCSTIESKRVDLKGLKIDYFIGNQDDFNVLLNNHKHKCFCNLAKEFNANLLIIQNSLSCTVITSSNQRTIHTGESYENRINVFGYKDRFLAFFIQQIKLKTDIFLAVSKSLKSINTSKENYDEKFNSFKDTINTLTINSKIDSLTGIMNRSSFDVSATKLKQTVLKNTNEKVYIALIDIDFFKNVNDTHGHAVGDLVIQNVVNQIKKTIREDVIFARYGGEEFAIIAKLNPPNSEIFFDRILKSVENNPLNYKGETIKSTISIGYALCSENLQESKNQADIALYQAKDHGRNNAKFYDVSFELLNCK